MGCMAKEFASFYRDSRDSVFRAVVATIGSTAEAEDVVAEAYARAFANWSSVVRHPKPEAWVVVTALNYQRSMWRRLRRLVPIGDHEPESPAVPDPAGPTISAVYALPRRQRQAIALCVLLELDSEEAGEALGIAASTVRVHLHRGLETLRNRLNEGAQS